MNCSIEVVVGPVEVEICLNGVESISIDVVGRFDVEPVSMSGTEVEEIEDKR